jgi:hypothetical protein
MPLVQRGVHPLTAAQAPSGPGYCVGLVAPASMAGGLYTANAPGAALPGAALPGAALPGAALPGTAPKQAGQ